MPAFKVRKVKNGMFEVVGLEAYIARTVAALMGNKASKTPAKRAAKPTQTRLSATKINSLELLLKALNKHPRRSMLLRAGKEKDQLLRSLVPLYLARDLKLEVNSGLISRFWARHGVRYAPPNAAKALRQHVGYARQIKGGRQITPNGIKYIESNLLRRAA
jgi:hypothetical protein